MPASVVIVHNDSTFVAEATAALRAAGHDVTSFSDPMAALDALEVSQRAQVLVTRVTFPNGKPNGVSLALVARTKRPRLKVLFAARAHWQTYTDGIGEFIEHPIDLPKLVETVTRQLSQREAEVTAPARLHWRRTRRAPDSTKAAM